MQNCPIFMPNNPKLNQFSLIRPLPLLSTTERESAMEEHLIKYLMAKKHRIDGTYAELILRFLKCKRAMQWWKHDDAGGKMKIPICFALLCFSAAANISALLSSAELFQLASSHLLVSLLAFVYLLAFAGLWLHMDALILPLATICTLCCAGTFLFLFSSLVVATAASGSLILLMAPLLPINVLACKEPEPLLARSDIGAVHEELIGRAREKEPEREKLPLVLFFGKGVRRRALIVHSPSEGIAQPEKSEGPAQSKQSPLFDAKRELYMRFVRAGMGGYYSSAANESQEGVYTSGEKCDSDLESVSGNYEALLEWDDAAEERGKVEPVGADKLSLLLSPQHSKELAISLRWPL